jgi:hypothetical protein
VDRRNIMLKIVAMLERHVRHLHPDGGISTLTPAGRQSNLPATTTWIIIRFPSEACF